ncbi:MAG: DUF2382 domain-containing protein [Oscillatoriaceae cyanobacterium Prado104]|jgi:uncharacterized protein (TIGR02271 family)|nr:DUF2382 domain-containing protein [Oscillatoriaceae cyanobacterium Prado104]
MLLYKIEDFNPNYRQEAFDGDDIKGLELYAGNTNDKIGTIDTVLVDETGRFRYFVVETGSGMFGKKVLLPVALSRVDINAQRIYATSLRSKDQLENLPRYEHGMVIDYDYEEQVRGNYRTPTVEASVPVEASLPLDAPSRTYKTVETSPVAKAPVPVPKAQPVSPPARKADFDRDSYTYDREPELYQMNEQDHQKLRLYEERLVAGKTRRKTGEVAIGKRVETEQARVQVPVEKERVIIERVASENTGTPVTPDTAFQQQEMARLEVYEETADIKKQAFVREEVQIRKEVEQETVEATDTIRREELDIKKEGISDANRR